MVGTSGYTIVALIGIARATNPLPYGYFNTHPMAGEVLLIVATWFGIFLWLFTCWVFFLAVCINLFGLFEKKDGKWQLSISFSNVAWSLIFPVTGFTLSTVSMAMGKTTKFSRALLTLLRRRSILAKNWRAKGFNGSQLA